MTDRIVSRRPLEEDQQWEPTLRPKIWDEYIGQEKVKENLRVFIEAARARREPLDHVLLHGPPGLGKTTLAYLIATELQVGIRATSGPVLERPVIGYPSYYWNNGELAEYQKRLLSPESIAQNGIFNYEGVMRILEEEKHSEAKSVGKHSWALTQFCLWYEIHIKRNPAFL